jgi:hypothetical protein
MSTNPSFYITMSAEVEAPLTACRYEVPNWMTNAPIWETCITSQSAIPQNSDTGPATQDPTEMQTSDPGPAASKQGQDAVKKRKCTARKCNRAARTSTSKRPSENPWHLRALLRRFFFINAEKSRCFHRILSRSQLPSYSRIWRIT